MLLQNAQYPQDPRVRHEARALSDAGCQVTVIAPGADQPQRENVDGVYVYRFPRSRGGQGMLGYFWEYGYGMVASFLLSLWVFCRRGFDVVHAHNPPDTFVFLAAFYRLFGKKFVFDHHDLSPEMYYARFPGRGNRFVYRVLAWLEKLSCGVADQVIATSQSYKEVQMERGRVPEERITIVRNGPHLERLKRVAPDLALRRKADVILGYVGSMGYQDGVDYLLRAVYHLLHDLNRRDFYCVLMGAGDAHDDVRALAHELELDDFVWFTGVVSEKDLVRYLSTADIFLAPEPRNPFTDRSTMIKVMEYMAMRRPTVAFDLTEHRVSAGEAALYAKPNDERDFATLIAQLMDNPDQRRRMGALGRQRIESELAWPHQEPHLLDVYRKLGMLPPKTSQASDPHAIGTKSRSEEVLAQTTPGPTK